MIGPRPFFCCALCLFTLLSACRYQARSPGSLDEALALHVAGSQTRLVRGQALLHEEVGRAIRSRLGWRLHPLGTARLDLLIERESIDSAAQDVDGISIRWRIVLRARALLHTERGSFDSSQDRGGSFLGVGYSSGRQDEAQALRDAAKNLASQVTDWLEHRSADWKDDAPPP